MRAGDLAKLRRGQVGIGLRVAFGHVAVLVRQDKVERHSVLGRVVEVQIFLLGKKVEIELSETPHFKGARFDPVETVSFMWHKEGVHAELYELDDLRGALKPRADGRVLRADTAAVRTLPSTPNHSPQELA